MKSNPYFRILALAPSSRGFGFAVLEKEGKLIDWGVRSIKGDKNAVSIVKVKELIAHYHVGAVVVKNFSWNNSRRYPRVEKLCEEISAAAKSAGVKSISLSQKNVTRALFQSDQGTKYQVAQLLAARFPEELGSRLPPKRRFWMSEDHRVDIFEAGGTGPSR